MAKTEPSSTTAIRSSCADIQQPAHPASRGTANATQVAAR